MIEFKQSGDFSKTNKFLKALMGKSYYTYLLEHYGKVGVKALSEATPKDTGKTAASWTYQIAVSDTEVSITWTNDNTTATGIPIVVLIQYGHVTRNGGYVEGIDFVNPTMQPIFDQIAEKLWKAVVSS